MFDDPLPPLEGAAKTQAQGPLIAQLARQARLDGPARAAISARAADLVRAIRGVGKPALMEAFLSEYGLSTAEGVALMALAEAMLRVPDPATADALIADKIAPQAWEGHLFAARSALVNTATGGLVVGGRLLRGAQIDGLLGGAIRRLGLPAIRAAVARAMKEMGRQFVLGETIEAALNRARPREAQGYLFSYDMLGEAAITAKDAARYRADYARAIAAVGAAAGRPAGGVADSPGISVKLSALHPRYEVAQEARVMAELVPVLRDLARAAAAAGLGLTVDAEEQDRLALSLRVIEAVLADPQLAGWDGFGVVVQAYGKRAGAAIARLQALAGRLDRRLAVRLVKGAYWDAEMKRAQVEGLADFPLFTTKAATDVAYLGLARQLFDAGDRLYPQFATHNAHTVAAIVHMAEGRPFEFQRLHGMGAALHEILRRETGTRCRIYAPVGAHRDLLAYLVRRLLENGANSSFVHHVTDPSVAPETVAACPFAALEGAAPPPGLVAPADLFAPVRRNSRGLDLTDREVLAGLEAARAVALPDAAPILACERPPGPARPVTNPADGAVIAQVHEARAEDVAAALDLAAPWSAPAARRAEVLARAADLFEENTGPLLAVLAREAGKTLPDAMGELREAVDFLTYYAAGAGGTAAPLGRVAAISPWNFPLAIFTGQVAAALAAGNAVLAKPAEQTPLVAAMAVRLLHRAGVPRTALQLLPGTGPEIGAGLTRDARIDGVLFTGSTETARRIRETMAEHLAPGATLVAETGGLNAMIVDATALPEQAVRDIVASAFRSAGQRCSALRCLYVQEEIAPRLIEMIRSAMDVLALGDPWHLATDVGPVIDAEARATIADHVARAQAEGRLIHALSAPEGGHAAGHFVAPALIRVGGIGDLEREIFGPVLHVATYPAGGEAQVLAEVAAAGYGLTLGLHSRIASRHAQAFDAAPVGNTYVNRNQIGAVVGSQPFGGEGLSGTGPKAGGPHYLARLTRHPAPDLHDPAPSVLALSGPALSGTDLAGALAAAAPARVLSETDLPGPTGETNRLRLVSRAPLLCLGPGPAARAAQVAAVTALGGQAVPVCETLDPAALEQLAGFSGVIWWGDAARGRAFAQALSRRAGPIVPLITGAPDAAHVAHERHLCVDTTAAGGNAALLAGAPPPA
ncbi:bifunctional proline dehydrogenase/L-glutamate gamma-semialdehyde dehydrogenase PutA [Phaeovulum vinaykumarii]|uniref:Bifunctional protein PutA n=1 Tax=Phaeovulum vinaykumarii TaxID=407234 RepID=A0A1N7JLU5_9RHOB|nr:bifunctional proline dehydrogenase/L-glutamate gamma-semialdehyde dehydrogenase PutA [Phaeovulum vinaykumarii]SIS50275.1 L-proline dehydrogenase /delta-1-pyrroline-5-carboxylate dehydrogenase [Phaeovulum vinaykumarii]SOB90188.1 L-proline dehydrogenase /delta-1-pyrroline-5-carboxylate dehydrogenase [Phaeovulum vinaykumarii]